MKKKILVLLCFSICLMLSFSVVLRLNPYLRTDIFRSIAKGNWYITGEKDTLYTMGYFGVRKYLINSVDDLVLLAKNEGFTSSRIVARGGSLSGDYLYVTLRNFLKKTEAYGALVVLRKSNLSVVSQINYDFKLIKAKIVKNKYLVASGIGGFNIYDISTPSKPKEVFTYKHHKHREYQGFDFFETNGKGYIAFAQFGEGIGIWEIAQSGNALPICEVSVNRTFSINKMPFYQTMDLIVDFPYLYATLATQTEDVNVKLDKRGLIILDISDFNKISDRLIPIPSEDWYSKNTGDRQPTYITKYNKRLYVNFAEKGLAVFDLDNPAKPEYKGTIDPSGEGALIQPVYATETGKLFAGSYYWKTIYGLELEN